MGKTINTVSLCILILLLSDSAVLAQTSQLSGADSTDTILKITGLTPVELPESKINSGLRVRYYLNYFKRDVRYMQRMQEGEFESFDGPPITHLNHQFHKNKVFDSGTNRGVAMRMRGYLNFPQTGVYGLQALSNDGIILLLADTLTLSDPKQHSDRLSHQTHININRPGWFPVTIDYFQRKGTSALKLFWKKPGSTDYTIVPATAYGHVD